MLFETTPPNSSRTNEGELASTNEEPTSMVHLSSAYTAMGRYRGQNQMKVLVDLERIIPCVR